MSLRDRIRKLEQRLKHQDAPTSQQYLQAHRRNVARLHAKIVGFFGEPPPAPPEGDTPEQRRKDEETIRRWQKAQGVSEEEIAGQAETARAKLRALGRRTSDE